MLFQRILLLAVVATIAAGFYFKTDDPSFGDLLIGCGLVVGFFVLMPLFIYSRYNGKDLSRYMLSEENIKRMRRYQHGDEEE